MAKTPKPKPKDEDPEQSKRFLDLAAELEAAGDLSPTEGAATVERILRGPKRGSPKKDPP